MGFEVRRTAVLEFAEDTALAGATVRASLDMTVREFMALQRSIAALPSAVEDFDDAAIEAWEETYRRFGDEALKSWDIEMDGVEVPATGAGMLTLPFKVANEIFSAWGNALAGAPPNSAAASGTGEPPAAATTASRQS